MEKIWKSEPLTVPGFYIFLFALDMFLYHLDVFLQAVGCRGDFAGRKNEISRKLRPNGFSHK